MRLLLVGLLHHLLLHLEEFLLSLLVDQLLIHHWDDLGSDELATHVVLEERRHDEVSITVH